LAGIYIHIPFCRQKCHYCNFFSLASKKLTAPFLEALKKEIDFSRDYLAGEPVHTVYFGGGTPSLYPPGVLQELLPSLIGEWSGEEPMEITLELNPEDVTREYVKELKGCWFNRFSIGVQSFSDGDLAYLNRSHSARQSILAVNLLQDAGYENISIDLIYGIPCSDMEQWQTNLDTVFSLGIPHISAYALTVEPKTPLAWKIGKQRSAAVGEETQADQFKMLMQKTKEEGFLQYEISNFCKPGRHAVHNSNYWNRVPYLGMGPSAHSFNGSSRRWNVANLSGYIDGINNNACIYEEEVLTTTQKYNEYVMTSLRTMWGCNLQKINDALQMTNEELFKKTAARFIEKGMLTENSGTYFLTDEGKLFADRVASELFMPE
jgi:oxygen-independent coproporphyrinogen III oxidase